MSLALWVRQGFGVLWLPAAIALLPYFVIAGAWKAGRNNLYGTYRVLSYVYAHLLFMLTMVPQMVENWLLRWWNAPVYSKNALPLVKSIDYETPISRKTATTMRTRCRNRLSSSPMSLDVYPMPQGSRAPVIVYLYGGSFSSGEKFYYFRLAMKLRQHCNAVVVVPDYPTYPRGTIQEMSESVARCLMWTGENAEKYGGSRDHIWVVGHSAGAFLAAYTLLRSMMAKASGRNALPEALCAQGACDAPIPLFSSHNSLWEGSSATPTMPHPSHPSVAYEDIPNVEGCILLSGLYNLRQHVAYERKHYVDLISSMSASTGGFWDSLNLPRLCETMENDPQRFKLRSTMCPTKGFHFLHGTKDSSVDVRETRELHNALNRLSSATFKKGHNNESFSLCPADITDTIATHVGAVWGIVSLPEGKLENDPSLRLIKSLIINSSP